MTWHAFDEGRTCGTLGTECGVIVRDEEHAHGARLTLERNAAKAPYAITCGVYGCLVHTRFFSTQQEAQEELDAMKQCLDALLSSGSLEHAADWDFDGKVAAGKIQAFLDRFD